RMGMPSFTKVLEAVSDTYRNRREEVVENANQIRNYLVQASATSPKRDPLNAEVVDQAVRGLARAFDPENGGFGAAPKFPQPALVEFLLRTHRRTGDERAAAMAKHTLDRMATGGVYDQIGGGFHRYAVDAIWLVPHFEKMLYDNAQLARVYLDGYRAFGDERYRRVATQILDYVLREMTSPDGGFYATQDADTEGEEGKFYVWSKPEIEEVLGAEEAAVVARYYGVIAEGNFEGHNVLNVPEAPEEVAEQIDISLEALEETVERARGKLFEAREKRIRPGRDEKVLVSWNGLMLRAFAEASRVLGRPDYRSAAERNAEFLLAKLQQDGRLLHSFKDGVAKIPAFLDDYANMIDGLLALYEATFERRWLDESLRLTETMIADFADEDGVGFYDTGVGHEDLISRPRDLQDGATPAGNSVAASVLLKLAAMTGGEGYQRRATAILGSMARAMAEHSTGFGRFLSALDAYLATPREVAIAGKPGDAKIEAFAAEVFRRYEPNAVIGLANPDDPKLAERLPFLANRPMRDGAVTAYLCERYACLPPVTDPADLAIQLEQGTGIGWQEF
ncbi:MAG: thioredoxin domain-containing protein, partial [Thermomicrobiales bacterium]